MKPQTPKHPKRGTYHGPRWTTHTPAPSDVPPKKKGNHRGGSSNGGKIGGHGFIAHGLQTDAIVVQPGSVWAGHPGYDLDRRPTRCVLCGHVPKARGNLEEDGSGGLVCQGKIACAKRQEED